MAKVKVHAGDFLEGDSFRPEDVNADLTARKVALAHRLMVDTLVSVQQDFVEYDVMPKSITRKHSNDISLEFEPDRGHGEERFVRGGVWFAFRFGQGKNGPLNDVPNVSIIFFEHGLDLVINCEVAASQMRFLKRITTAPARFDELIGANSGLFLKAYLKFEQQPIGYHWILTEYLTGDSISANRVEAIHSGYEHKYEEYRTKWLDYIELHSDELSDDQRVHMRKMNRRLNLAWRLGRNVAKDDPMWLEPHEEQVRFFRREIAKMKPLVEFFVPKA